MVDPASDRDAPGPDTGEPDGIEPDAVEPDAGDPEIIEEDVAEPPPVCGNGIVEIGEECDDTSGFCAGCVLTAPTEEWTECTDSGGHKAFLLAGNCTGRSYDSYRNYCKSIVEGFSPVGYRFYGLAVFFDESIWDCIRVSLDTSANYIIGLFQDPTGAEPNGGWYWEAWDGTSWINVADLDTDMTYIGLRLDDLGFGLSIDCGSVGFAGSQWTFEDNPCGSLGWNINCICMIQY
jgi:hypothetical protein